MKKFIYDRSTDTLKTSKIKIPIYSTTASLAADIALLEGLLVLNLETNSLVKIVNGSIITVVDSVSAGIPTGSITPFAGSTPPNGYLLCDGRAVSRSDYSDLFNVIGTNYGVGDGSTTFNLPDLREATTKGKGLTSKSTIHYSSTGPTLGEFIDDRILSHTHTYSILGVSNSAAGGSKAGVSGYDTSFENATGYSTNEVNSMIMNYIIKV